MPSLRKFFNSHSVSKLAVKLVAAEAIAWSVAGCAMNPPPQIDVPPPPSPTVAKPEPSKGLQPVLINPAVPHVLGSDAHSVSPWQDEVAYPEKNYFDKWFTLMGRYQVMLTNPTNRKIVDDFFAQFDSLKHKPIEEKATAVEKAVNSYITYKSDKDLYQLDDYLASPLETIVNKGGDCEDYAILKYYALRHLGVPAENMFLVFVPQDGPDAHEILLVNTSGPGQTPDYLDLDNHTDTSLKRGKDLPYKAYYLVNETGIWVTAESPYVKEHHKVVGAYPQTFSP